ncbi:MAG: protein-L-isoaspartate(D-aspartate) O-methyltransferase [Planctomycetota bacterium]|nr:protein-L-isoaspartate(D-aspartate) O-methyltransferase [Planctomycetota bacterium]
MNEGIRRMIERDIAGRGIRDPRVIAAMGKVDRALFVPPEWKESAYDDHPLSIGAGQTISQPYMVAFMTEALGLSGDERVLEIGTGSGYQTAILAELAREVYTVERIESLATAAEDRLVALGYANIRFHLGDGSLGWREYAPYDRIIVTAAAPAAPPSLIGQIAEGGRMVIPVGPPDGQALEIIERREGRILRRNSIGCIFVPLVGKEGFPGGPGQLDR